MNPLVPYLRAALESGIPPSQSERELEAAIGLARANKLSFVVTKYLNLNDLNSHLRNAINAERLAIAQLNGHVLHTASKIGELFEAEKIPYFFFKGPIQQKLLHGDFFVKPSADLDVLVHRRDFRRAREALQGAGYVIPLSRNSLWWTFFLGEQPFKLNGGASPSVDLHHRLQQPGCPTPRRLSYFFDNLEMVNVGSRALPTANVSAVALISAMNLLKAVYHREPAGSYAFDLLMALTQLDRDHISKLLLDAAALGLHGTLLGAVSLSVEAFDTGNPLVGFTALRWPPVGGFSEALLDPNAYLQQFPKRRNLLVDLIDQPVPYAATDLGRWCLSEGARILFER